MSNVVFQRQELKYLISYQDFNVILPIIKQHLLPDQFGFKTIQSLYLDTDDYRLIRNSIDKPFYKEKIRLRSYNLAIDKQVFLELKKKCDNVVFKRRIILNEEDAFSFFDSHKDLPDFQIANEIKYFVKFYQDLKPKFLIIYDRKAYYGNNSDLRITFDENVRYRTNKLNLHTSLDGKQIPQLNNRIIMEIKSTQGLPSWLLKLLSDNKIYKTSFSKYGEAYKLEFNNIHKKEEIKIG